jgi:uncharacterized protein (DUF697 family)/tellurite resistance protein
MADHAARSASSAASCDGYTRMIRSTLWNLAVSTRARALVLQGSCARPPGGLLLTMTTQDAQTIVAIAALAAMADGMQSDAERTSIAQAALRLGLSHDDGLGQSALKGTVNVGALVARLSGDEARVAAYDAAAAVCHADGQVNAGESAFLSELLRALGASVPAPAASPSGVAPAAPPPADNEVETFILDQAMLTAACDVLPDALSSMAIMPLQLRLVYSIGKRHGQQFSMAQAKDLLAAFGIGTAGHMMEGIVRGVLGGVGGSLLGGLLGGAAGVAAGSAVTFATTYALGHAAEQYYAQGRELSAADLHALFQRFRGEASTIFPRVEGRVRELAAGTNFGTLLAGLRAAPG